MPQLSQKSLAILDKVHPRLAKVIKAAADISSLDFEVVEGIRSRKSQLERFLDGRSQEESSIHFYGYAVDILVYIDEIPCWQSAIYSELAESIKLVASDLGISIRWGGAYHCLDITKTELMMEELHFQYLKQAKYPLIDLPHFELGVE